MKSEIPFLAAAVLIGTASQGVEQAVFSTAMEYSLKCEKEKVKERPLWMVDLKCLATFLNLFSISDSPRSHRNRRPAQARKNHQL